MAARPVPTLLTSGSLVGTLLSCVWINAFHRTDICLSLPAGAAGALFRDAVTIARLLWQLAASRRERHLLRQGWGSVHLVDARVDRVQLLDGHCRGAPQGECAQGLQSSETEPAFAPATRLLAFTIIVNLLVLGVFKYANFFADNVNGLFSALHVDPLVFPRILLPIGISFFTFHAISYVVDVYRGDATAQKSPVHAALYLLLFPQLIAGPIIRYRDIADQLAQRHVGLADFAYGVRRFVIGLAKKVLIANIVAGAGDKIFSMAPDQLSAGHAWLGILCYTLQIYFDFSGYSDMAIGLGRMFGFRFPENFRWPYSARTVQDFWRRWHMSLSTWFRDYLYVPLGGNRVSCARMYGNLVVVFFLCGLWHGASWNFVIWACTMAPSWWWSGSGWRPRGIALASPAPRGTDVGRDDRLGVLSGGDSARRARLSEGHGRIRPGPPNSVLRYLAPHARTLAGARRGRHRLSPGRVSGRAMARALDRGAATTRDLLGQCRDCDARAVARRFDYADRSADL